jgi:3-methyl-2-oxobutanoate hydroxymethyltransferase
VFQHFLSRATNFRSDEYGGSLANRARLLREVIEDTKDAVGDTCAVPVRIAMSEFQGAAGLEPAEVEDAIAMDAAGAFAMVIEGVLEPIAIEITQKVACPTIGIGASAQCDGQVLVTEDMLGLFERTPKFVRRYAGMSSFVDAAVQQYANDVRNRSFPGEDQLYLP